MMHHSAVSILADPATAVIDRGLLTRAFDIIDQAVVSRNTLPILTNARMIGDGSTLFATGTDLDVELTVAIPAAADARFAMTLPSRQMRDLLRKATKSDFVAFTMPDEASDKATADFERVKYHLSTLPVADYPDFEGPSPLSFNNKPNATYRSFEMTGASFWAAIDATMEAVSTEETRYYLNGIYMHVAHDGGLRFVATDGHRLFRQDMAAPEGAADMPGVIIPRKTVSLLHKLLKGKACPDKVGIELTETKLRVTWGDDGFYVTLQSKFVDGTFPDYERVIPAYHDKSAAFEPASMLEAIRAVSLISSERGKAVKMTMNAGKISVAVNDPEAGSAVADVPASYDGDGSFDIGFNAKYLIDTIITASPDGENVKWRGSASGDPATFTGSREGWMAVLMPMRI